MLAVQTGMRLGQLSISPALGRMADRIGNRAGNDVLPASDRPRSAVLLFFHAATAVVVCWRMDFMDRLRRTECSIAQSDAQAFAGPVSGATTNLRSVPGLSSSESNTPYIATYFTVTGLCYAANTILGGWLFDHYGQNTFLFFGSTIDYNQWIFLIGWAARCLGIFALLLVIEPRTNQL